jgi:hypothetical protein
MIIEMILEFVLTAIWEILLQIVGEILVEFGFQSIGDSVRQRARLHPVFAGAGAALLGGLAGLLTSLVWPTRILQPGPFRGASLLVSPVITGLVMDRYGQWREDRGAGRSFIATFWGGAIFAFTMALVRFVWVGAVS